MRRLGLAMVSLALAFAFLAPSAALADQRFTITISPEYFLDSTGDSSAPVLGPTYLPAQCPGYNGWFPGVPACPGSPRTTSDTNLDYGVSYEFGKRWSLSYTHSAFDFSLGRISLAGTPAGTSILTGDVMDRTDQGTLTYNYGHGLTLDAYYFSHQRSNVQATSFTQGCLLNSESCPGGTSNPSSINSNAWGAGAAYAFGPHTVYEPPMFKAGVDVNYYPRPNDPNCLAAVHQPACNTNGIPGYRGSGAVFPYSLTFFPISDFKGAPLGFIPFVAYNRLYAWFHAENSAEAYNAVAFGFVQVLPHGLSFTYTNFKLNGCYCSDTLPPPESVRSDTNIFKLSYDLKF